MAQSDRMRCGLRWLARTLAPPALGLVALLAGCGPGATPIRTPIGPIAADFFEPFDLIGVSDVMVHTRTGAQRGSISTDTVEIPAGTEFVVPVLAGWRTWYGEEVGTDGDMPFGMALLRVRPLAWELPDDPAENPTAPVGFADVFVGSDRDQVTGVEQHFRLLFLRRSDNPLVPEPPGGVAERWRLVAEDATFPRGPGRPNADAAAEVAADISVPGDAEEVIAALQGFVLGYGEHGGALAPAVRQPNDVDDQNIQQARVTVEVDATAATTRGTTTSLLLRDDDGIEPWYGGADYQFLSARRDDGSPGRGFRIVGILGRFNDVQVSVEASDDVERPGFHRQRYTAFVPAETDMVVPLLSGWSLGYGELLIDPEPGDLLWGGTTNQFGVGQVSVLVVGLSAGPTPEFKQASILVTLGLRDQGGDDYWFGSVDYTLLCLDLVDG